MAASAVPCPRRKGYRMHYIFGVYHLDTQRYELHHAGVLVPLRPKVFQVLAYLVAQHERVVHKEELLEALWPGQFVGDVGLNTYIMEVRKALGDRRPPYQYIRTVRGQGYRVVAPVEARDHAPPLPPLPGRVAPGAGGPAAPVVLPCHSADGCGGGGPGGAHHVPW